MKRQLPTCADCRHTVPLRGSDFVVCLIYHDCCRSDSPATCGNFLPRVTVPKPGNRR